MPLFWAAQDEALQQGLAALKDNHLDLALDRLTAAERELPFNAQVRNFRGIVLAQLGRISQAQGEYHEAVRLDPKLEDAWKNLGFIEWTEHDLDAARESLMRALQLAPDDAFARYYLGRVHLDAKHYESAFQELDQSRALWPSDPDFLIQASTGYRALGRTEDAKQILARLRTIQLSDKDIVDVAARLISIQENGIAIELLRKVNTTPQNSSLQWAQFDLALAYLFSGAYGKAIDDARELVKPENSSTETASSWSLIGIASARLNQDENAVLAFRNACKLDSAREEHWLNLSRELMDLNHYADAISAVQEGLDSNPKSYALHLRLGAAYLASDHYPEAEHVFRQLTSAGDPLPTSYIGLAQVLLRTGRALDAVSELRAAEDKLGPRFLTSYFLGLALTRAGKPGDAIPALEEAIRFNPNSTEAHLALGKASLAAGRLNEAKVELEHALRLDANNLQAQRLLIQVRRRTGDTQAAAQTDEPSAEEPKTDNGDMLGDFLAPDWQTPPEDVRH